MGPFLKARSEDHAIPQKISIATVVFVRLLSSSHCSNENDFSALDFSLDLVL